VLVVSGLGHGISGYEDTQFGTTHQAALEEWFQSIVSSDPPKVIY
jgi:hypothetical protein